MTTLHHLLQSTILIPEATEQITILYQNATTRIEHIVSNRAKSLDDFFYDQDEDELVSVIQGSAQLLVMDELIYLKAGDSVLLPAHTLHRVVMTSSDCVWLCVFTKNEK